MSPDADGRRYRIRLTNHPRGGRLYELVLGELGRGSGPQEPEELPHEGRMVGVGASGDHCPVNHHLGVHELSSRPLHIGGELGVSGDPPSIQDTCVRQGDRGVA